MSSSSKFRHEPGVVHNISGEESHKRPKDTMGIPEYVAMRVYRRVTGEDAPPSP